MNKNLELIARQLSESDIQELLRIKKSEDKKLAELRQKRDKLAADLADLDAQLADDEPEAPVARKPRRGGRKPRQAATKEVAARKPAKRGGRQTRGGKVNVAGAVREAFKQAGEPLRARQVVDLLPKVGIKVTDDLEMRKRVSVILAQHKSSFEQIERGLYRLKED